MTRRIVSIIALTSLWAFGAQAQPGPANPGEAPKPHAHPPGPPGAPPGARPGIGHERPNLAEMKDRLGQGAADGPNLQDRIAQLKTQAEKLRKEGREKQAEMLEKQAERLSANPTPGPAANPANKGKIRQARKLARIKLLQRRYGEALKDNAVRDEVETHARRSANLSRMKSLVGGRPDGDDKQKESKQKLVERINRLMARENARHSRNMAKLTKQEDSLANKTITTPPRPKAPEATAEVTKEKAEK